MKNLHERIQTERMVEDLWRLVRIPSPTGQERDVAFEFARMLADAGADVRLDETLRESPSVIGRLAGKQPGKTFQLAGHLDHINVPHAPPARTAQTVSGRGSADMKNGLAGILEVIRVLKESGCDFPGQVLVTAYGLHEAPVGDSSALLHLIHERIVGDAALVAETEHSAEGKTVIMGKGQSIWNVTVRRKGEICHELSHSDPHALLSCSQAICAALQERHRQLQAQASRFQYLGPESLFIGQMHYGDFYNRVPVACTLQGTRRWHPGHTFADMQSELEQLLRGIECPASVTAEGKWLFVGEAYALDIYEPVVQAQQRAYEKMLGRTAEYAGLSALADASRLVPLGKVPTVLCGFDNQHAHADEEYIRIDRLRAPCQIMLLTLLNYLQSQA